METTFTQANDSAALAADKEQMVQFKADLFMQQADKLEKSPEFSRYIEAKKAYEESELFQSAAQTKEELKELVIDLGKTVKSGSCQIQYVSGSDIIKWDHIMLMEFAKENPKILDAMSVKKGSPSARVVIKKE